MTMPYRPVNAAWMCRSLVPLLDAGATGLVQSTSARAINVAVEGRLVWLVASGSSRLPGGIGLDRPDGLESIGLTAGDVVSLAPAGLSAALAPRGTSRFERPIVSFATAVPWEAVLAPGDEAVSPSRLRRSWSLAPATGFGDQSSDPIRGWRAIERLDRGLRAESDEDVMSAVTELIGRGPGLTPSGDDLLVGCSAALRAFGHAGAGAFAAGAAAAARGRTTAVAQAYHEHAAAGRYAEHLHALARALGDAGGDLEAAVGRSLAWGATSGADTLLGVLLGAEACTVPATATGRWPAGADR